MPELIRFHLDEPIDRAIAVALRKRDINVTRTQQMSLTGSSDIVQLGFCCQTSRVMVSTDTNFLALVRTRVDHPGFIYASKHRRTLGEIIDFLVLVHQTLAPEEMHNHIEFA